jgi:hypothetical protein
VFGFNNYFGPDIGAVIWFLTKGINNDLSYWILFLFHNPYVFPFTLGLPLAYLWRKLTQLSMDTVDGKKKIVKIKENQLSLEKCFMLVVAGGFSHFFIDYLFDGAGRSKTFLWVINTGYWNDPYFDAWIIIPIILLIGFILIFLQINKNRNEATRYEEWKKSVILLIIYIVLFEIYLGVRISMGLPALGEEADFGVIIFLGVFLFFPLILCLLSTKDLWQYIKKK